MKLDFLKTSKNKIMLGTFIALGLLSLILTEKKETAPPEKAPVSADTFIPKGYVLVPIEVANANSLSSLLGEVGGVVDLYLPQGKKTSLRIATKVKILRAPYNPDLYAVLVREQESNRILSYAGPFVAVVQNPNAQGMNLTEVHSQKISIEYQN